MIKHRNGGVEYAAEGFIIHDVAGCAEDGDLAVVHGADVVGVGGVLGQHHGDVGALALAAGEFVEVAVLKVDEVEEFECLVDVRDVFGA